MPRGTVFGNERGYQPNAVNVRVRPIRLGENATRNFDVLDDLSKLMRLELDCRERDRADSADTGLAEGGTNG